MSIKDRQRIDDHYSQKARKEGYPARSVYKLEEIDKKYKLLKRCQKILDLGCAPGSWTLYAAAKVGNEGRVIGLDLQEVSSSFPPQVTIWQADLLEASSFGLVEGEGPFDLVLSDMAPRTMGQREVDQARSLELSQTAWSWAERMLAPGAHFLFKLFQSQDGEDFIKQTLQPRFDRINRLKPKATRSQSLEMFVLGQGFKTT